MTALPLRSRPAATVAPHASAATPAAVELKAAPAAHARGWVLVVDDDPHIVSFVAEALEDEGFDTASAHDGAAALVVLARRPDPPAVILLDFNMPVCDGPDFVRAYRAGPPPHAPIICTTAAHSASARWREMGADDYLGKPFGLDDLIDRIEKHVGPPA